MNSCVQLFNCTSGKKEPTYVSGDSVDEPEEELNLSFSDPGDAEQYQLELSTPVFKIIPTSPPAIFISTPEETEKVMAMESSSNKRTRAFDIYNVPYNEDVNQNRRFDRATSGTLEENIIFCENEDEGWTTVGEVTFQMENEASPKQSSEKSKIFGKTNNNNNDTQKTKNFMPKFSPKKKKISKAGIESPVNISPKSSPQKRQKPQKLKMSPKKSCAAPKTKLPELLETSVQQYRPVYQSQALSNSNLVPKPYVSRYSTDSSTQVVRGPVASPRTLFPKEDIDKENQVIVPKEPKDTRGKIKKTTKNTECRVAGSPVNNANNANEIENPVSPMKEVEYATNRQEAKPYLDSDSGPDSSLPEKEEKKIKVHSFTTFDSPESPEDEVKDFSDELDPEECLALSALEAAVLEEPMPSKLYSCSNQVFNSYDELQQMSNLHPCKPGSPKPPNNSPREVEVLENLTVAKSNFPKPQEISVALKNLPSSKSSSPEPQRNSCKEFEANKKRPLSSATFTKQSTDLSNEAENRRSLPSSEPCSPDPYSSHSPFKEPDATRYPSLPRSKSPKQHGEHEAGRTCSSSKPRSPGPRNISLRETETVTNQPLSKSNSPKQHSEAVRSRPSSKPSSPKSTMTPPAKECESPLNHRSNEEQHQNISAYCSKSRNTDDPQEDDKISVDEYMDVSVDTLSRDSLDGFISDGTSSLRHFVAQKHLRVDDKTLAKPNQLKKDSSDSIEFSFEELQDSPRRSHSTHSLDSSDQQTRSGNTATEGKKNTCKTSVFGKFTQRVSDRNKENEEKSKSSHFSALNILSKGNKDKGKSKDKPKITDSSPKNDGWTTEEIEDYLMQNSREEALRLGLLDDEDVTTIEAKKEGKTGIRTQREAPEVVIHEVQKITSVPSSCKKRLAPVPPRDRSPGWKPQDIENYLLEHNMNENLRLGLLSKEDIEIYEWKRATGMSPICDTSWTRETLRKNKVVRGSSSSSMSPPTMSPEGTVPSSPTTVPKKPHELQPLAASRIKTPSPQIKKGISERGIDVPKSPIAVPPKRRGRAPPPPPIAPTPATSTPTTARKTSGHFAFRGFKLGQRVTKGVGDGFSLLSQAVSNSGGPTCIKGATATTQENIKAEDKTEGQETKPEPTKPESKPKRLDLGRIGVKLPGMGGGKESITPLEGKSQSSPAGTPEGEHAEGIPAKKEKPAEKPYRKLVRLLGKETSPTTSAVEAPSHALFLRESPRDTSEAATEDEEGGVRKKLSDMRFRLGWLRRRGEAQVSVRPQPEEVQGWAENFHNLMASKYGQALFKAFLQREFSEENVEFWLAVEDFKKTRAAKMPSKAYKIHSDYVALQAPKELNLDPGTRQQIAKSLDCPDKCIFDAAQKRVQALMESDAYLRFLQSELYKELLQPESSSANPETL